MRAQSDPRNKALECRPKGSRRFQKRGDPEQELLHPRHALRGRAGMNGRLALQNLTHTIPRERDAAGENRTEYFHWAIRCKTPPGVERNGVLSLTVLVGCSLMMGESIKRNCMHRLPGGIDNLQPPALPLIRIRGILGAKLLDGF